MPALTHGRVINGFNQYARTISYAQPKCDTEGKECAPQKALCCGRPLQPFKIRPGSYCGRGLCRNRPYPNKPSTRKYASATGTIGRRTTAKRAIYRRVANCQGKRLHNDKKGIYCCCSKPTCRNCSKANPGILQSFQTPSRVLIETSKTTQAN